MSPVSIVHLPSGRQVVDLGQNINGRLRLRVPTAKPSARTAT
ncbi:hypothetical protein PV458_25105 [Streptomyces sp. MN03-5084-2B]|nr:hypothetical protein [Streptomyces sp. MN03-5084-2B]